MNIEFNLLDYRAEDGGILDCWKDHCGNEWLFVVGHDCWLRWIDTHWAKDECRALEKQIQGIMDAMNQAAKAELAELLKRIANGGAEDPTVKMEKDRLSAWVSATKRSSSRVHSVAVMAQAQRAAASSMLDAGNVLNLKNGTLDLDALTLRPHSRDDHLTYCLNYEYNPDALAPRWEQYVSEVLVKDGTIETDFELCMLFQELLGYSLTNDTKHEVMTWLSGEGGNGKTVAITVIQWLLGVLSFGVDFGTIGMPGDYQLDKIQGRRVILSTESERGGKVAEGYIKRIVSGETITARPIYGTLFEFKSVSKVWWAMNDKPVIKDTGNSMWRRLKLIPFNRTFTEQDKDPDLLPKLKGELSGILNFALDGLRRLRQRGRFPESKAVQDAIKEYRQESNPVAQWLEERTTAANAPVTLSSVLYEDYNQWASQNGRQSLNSTNFGREMKRLKVSHKDNARGADGKVGVRYALALQTRAL